jgi:hypothetical protein
VKQRTPVRRKKYVVVEHTDTERLNALEKAVQERALTLWDGLGKFPGGTRGLSLRGAQQSLRRAIDECFFPLEEL